MTERERKDLHSVIHAARYAGRISEAMCSELVAAVDRARNTSVDALPSFPCGWPEPTHSEKYNPGRVVWALSDEVIVVANAEEARGFARRFLELAGEAEVCDRARNTEVR